MSISEKLGLNVQDLLKDGTKFNIAFNDINLPNNNAATHMNISLESYQLQQELIQSLKQNIELLKNENEKLKQDLGQINK